MGESLLIYFPIGLSLSRDELEDAIDEFLGTRGEVTGGGSGSSGSNIDIELADDKFADEVCEGLSQLLKHNGAPVGTHLVRPATGVRYEID